MKTKILFFLFSFLFFIKGNAQQSVNAAGGDATGSNGNISFSIGQIDYVSATGSNGSVSQGVQQPFEIFVLGVNNSPKINLEMKAYPNPITAMLYLKMSDTSLENLEYQLFDASGKLVAKAKIKNAETLIDLSGKTAGIYILIVSDASSKLKTFKIIKN